ncbi:uncharacterized protein PV09_08407 [Verruconis gallopava]|uniref:Uncharacterized protein n=1 Tax=Verruconis gallopava TaxID=253628 RepID=A0A0D2A0C7_9PEZI|nr:uncharacterized protein PV09_08407 [Verruconis gallopava]KIW00063.1 hypothetical protein PV09_08407 [Verruconis gallopava]
MSRDSSHTYLHLHFSHHAELLEDFTHPSTSHLGPDEIYLAPQHQPLNPEDEDDVVPDMHAAFGIQRATQKQKEPSWRDLGLVELMNGLNTGFPMAGGGGGGGGRRGIPIVSQGASGTSGSERAGSLETGSERSGNGSTADALRSRRRVEGTIGARLRG